MRRFPKHACVSRDGSAVAENVSVHPKGLGGQFVEYRDFDTRFGEFPFAATVHETVGFVSGEDDAGHLVPDDEFTARKRFRFAG